MNQLKPSSTLKNLISVVLTVLLLIFAYRYISDLVREADFESITINPALLVLSAILFGACYLILSIHWWLSCRIMKPTTDHRQTLAFFASQPYKYLPTSLFTFSSRAVYAKKLGLTLKQSSLTQFFENSSMLAANFGLFAVLYVARFNAVLGVTGALAIALALLLLRKMRNIPLRFRSRKLDVKPSDLVTMYAVATVGWLVSGLSFIVLNAALGFDIHMLDFLAANTIAFSLSILAFFAPGGIGVREVVYSFFSVNPATIIYWRIMTFVLDFVMGAVAILLVRLKSSDERQ